MNLPTEQAAYKPVPRSGPDEQKSPGQILFEGMNSKGEYGEVSDGQQERHETAAQAVIDHDTARRNPPKPVDNPPSANTTPDYTVGPGEQ